MSDFELRGMISLALLCAFGGAAVVWSVMRAKLLDAVRDREKDQAREISRRAGLTQSRSFYLWRRGDRIYLQCENVDARTDRVPAGSATHTTLEMNPEAASFLADRLAYAARGEKDPEASS